MITVIQHTESRSFDINYRSEDVKFSPSGHRLAVVATDGCILLFAVDLNTRPVEVRPEVELRSSSLIIPHGIDFLSEDVLVVANRNGNLVFFQIPPSSEWCDGQVIAPIHEVLSPLFGRTGVTRKLRDRSLFCGPGSVRLVDGILYVTCNYMNTVSTFSCRLDHSGLHVEEGVVVAHEGLSVVDGVAVSLNGRWMALSDHDHHRVAIFERTNYTNAAPVEQKLRADFRFSCSLTDFDMHFPHGLRFDHAGKVLYAVDAGGRFIHCFATTDNWQSDICHSTVKTFGIDQSAFTKSQDDVPLEHRILEGGGKGLDIDPSGRVLVVTCRNQSLRFFAIEEKVQITEQLCTQVAKETRGNADRKDFALSCLIDDTPGIWLSIVPWLATAIRLANVAPEFIHIHHVCPLSQEVARLCEKLGVNTHQVGRFDERNVYSNKIVQGATQFGNVNSVVLTDVDVVFTAPPPFQELEGFVAGKLVDMANPPLHILTNVFKKAGVKIIGIASNEYGGADLLKTFETIIGNFNGGVYVIPNNSLVALSQRWGVWARWLFDNAGLMERWAKHSDQVAFCLAVNELKIPIRILNNAWNLPTHLELPNTRQSPWIFHHHAQLNEHLQLKGMTDPSAQRMVERVNESIAIFREANNLNL